MQYEAEKFILAEKNITDALSDINDIITNIDSCQSNQPSGYEYSDELSNLHNEMSIIKYKVIEIQNTVTELRMNLCGLDPSFQSDYFYYKTDGLVDTIVLNGDSEIYVKENIISYVRQLLKSPGLNNDVEVVDAVCDRFQEEFNQGNTEAYKLLISMMQCDSLKFKLSDSSCYNSITKTVCINPEALKSSFTIFHEIGHALHFLITNHEIPDEFDKMKKKARKNIEENSYSRFMDYFCEFQTGCYTKFYNEILEKNNMNASQYLESKINEYNKISPIKIPSKIAQEFAEHEFHLEIYDKVNLEQELKGIVAQMDIMDAIFDGELDGTQQGSSGHYFSVRGHGKDYYDGILSNMRSNLRYSSAEYNEIIANYTSLKAMGNVEGLEVVKEMLGDELYNEVEKTYEKFMMS